MVVFCDGDFWHGRNWEKLRTDLERRHNGVYWTAKIARNRERDEELTARLLASGWVVLRLWETDVLRDPQQAAKSVKAIVDQQRTGGQKDRVDLSEGAIS